jgi:hypothetical protein
VLLCDYQLMDSEFRNKFLKKKKTWKWNRMKHVQEFVPVRTMYVCGCRRKVAH